MTKDSPRIAIQYAKAVKNVVDNYALLKKIRKRGKGDSSLLIKKKLKQVDQQKDFEKF